MYLNYFVLDFIFFILGIWVKLMMHVEQNLSYILFLQIWILGYNLSIYFAYPNDKGTDIHVHFWFSLITQINFNMYKNFDFDQICFLIRINTAPNHIYIWIILFTF